METKPEKADTRNVFLRVITSRKGFTSFVVFIIGLVFTVGIVISAIKGQITWDQAQTKIIAAFIAFTASSMIAQSGWAKEDSAEKSNTSNNKTSKEE